MVIKKDDENITVNFMRRVMDSATIAFVYPENEDIHVVDFESIVLVLGDATQSGDTHRALRSEEHTSELQSRETISYAVFCLKKKKKKTK